MTTPRRSDRYSDDWDGALCAQLGGAGADAIFFPTGPNQATQAIALCLECPLRKACILTALEEERGLPLHERFGIRGGLTAKERTSIDPGKTCSDCGTPIVTKSPHCDEDREAHRLAHRRDYEKERRKDAA